MKLFNKGYLQNAFAECDIRVPDPQGAEKSVVELFVMHSTNKLSTDGGLAMIVEPLRFAMRERYGEEISVEGSSKTYSHKTAVNAYKEGAIGITLGTSRPQEMLDVLGEMYARMDFLFAGFTDKGEVIMPKNKAKIPQYISLEDGLNQVLQATVESYRPKSP